MIIMTTLLVSMVCFCIVQHEVMYSRFLVTGTNFIISALEERLKVLPSLTSSALSDSVTLHWILCILFSPLGYYNDFRRLQDEKQGTAGKRKHVTNNSSET